MRAVADDREADRREAVPDTAEAGRDAEREPAACRSDLLRDDDDPERVLGGDEDARDELRCDESQRPGRTRRQHGADGEADDRREQNAATTEAIGEEPERERRQHAEPDDREHRADVRLGDAERRLDRRQRQHEDAEVVAVDRVGGAEEREDPPLARLHARRRGDGVPHAGEVRSRQRSVHDRSCAIRSSASAMR